MFLHCFVQMESGRSRSCTSHARFLPISCGYAHPLSNPRQSPHGTPTFSKIFLLSLSIKPSPFLIIPIARKH